MIGKDTEMQRNTTKDWLKFSARSLQRFNRKGQ